ncbi:MAG: DUF1707 domain-containing protein [Solirubrobacteraceae bacterium]
MRLSDPDRERLFERLKHHAATGALSLEELERRVELVARAETAAEAQAAMADLPASVGAPAPAPGQGRARGRRGHGHADWPEPDWQATSERFRDPRSGQVMRVWEDPADRRHYVPDAGN